MGRRISTKPSVPFAERDEPAASGGPLPTCRALTAIYNQAIAAGTCTCDTLPCVPLQRRAWFDSHQGKATPFGFGKRGTMWQGMSTSLPIGREERPWPQWQR